MTKSNLSAIQYPTLGEVDVSTKRCERFVRQIDELTALAVSGRSGIATRFFSE